MKNSGWVAGAVLLAAALSLPAVVTGLGCSRSTGDEPPKAGDTGSVILAKVETSEGMMVFGLHEDRAPNTVANFMHLASKGFYDGLIFHRVIADFMIQGGCPQGIGAGDPGWHIADEFVEGLKHDDTGVLSMANSGPNTNGSQFFVTLKPTPWLDGKHTVFGKVVEGLDVLEKIGSVKTDRGNRPLTPVTVKSITLFRDGQRLAGVQPMPETL